MLDRRACSLGDAQRLAITADNFYLRPLGRQIERNEPYQCRQTGPISGHCDTNGAIDRTLTTSELASAARPRARALSNPGKACTATTASSFFVSVLVLTEQELQDGCCFEQAWHRRNELGQQRPHGMHGDFRCRIRSVFLEQPAGLGVRQAYDRRYVDGSGDGWVQG